MSMQMSMQQTANPHLNAQATAQPIDPQQQLVSAFMKLQLPQRNFAEVLPSNAVEAGIKAAVEQAQREAEENRRQIEDAKVRVQSVQIPNDLAGAGLTHQDLLNELANVVPGINSPGSTSSAELRGYNITRETLERIARQKGMPASHHTDKKVGY
ncbi:MAG: hypothetical protein IT292_10950 [Deltaproteobacteria bacterium]|nr:hypothetical protein [Deltaproteobacteria bacterium]